MDIRFLTLKIGFEEKDVERILYLDTLFPEMKELSKKAFEEKFAEIDKLLLEKETPEVSIRELRLLFLSHAFVRLYGVYLENGYTEELYYGAANDLVSKARECFKMHGEMGIRPFPWFENWFKLKRFTLGRLQYGIDKTYPLEAYEKCGYKVDKGDFVLDCHIPADGPLTEELCFESYRLAYDFFKNRFPDGVMRVVCSTWLFTPAHLHVLGKNSQRFASDFDIVYTTTSDNFDEGWRVFNQIDMSDPDSLPVETSMQKRFVEYMKSGGKFGSGYGVFFFDGEKILK